MDGPVQLNKEPFRIIATLPLQPGNKASPFPQCDGASVSVPVWFAFDDWLPVERSTKRERERERQRERERERDKERREKKTERERENNGEDMHV